MTIREATPAETTDEEVPAPPPAARRLPLPAILLVILLIIGAGFRIHGLNWDDGKLLHPDELHITDVIASRIEAPTDLRLLLDPDRSPLNPRSVDPRAFDPEEKDISTRPRQFAYGSLPLFATDLAGWLWGKITDENWNVFWQIFRVGRAMTVICDLITILLTFGLARRAYGTAAGVLAAAFMAFATMPVQLAHFFVMDTWTATFITATLWATLVATRKRTARAFALAGFLAGCATATKATVVIIGFPIAVAAWLAATQAAALLPAAARAGDGAEDDDRRTGATLGRFAALALATGAAAFVAFFLFEPYAVLNPLVYIRDIGEQSGIISGKLDVPFTRQYIGSIPLVYQAKNLVGWELGPLLGGTVLAGLAWALWRTARRRDPLDIVLVSWVVPYLALLALNEAKFPRYLLPVLPVFFAYGAKLLVDLGAFSRGAVATPASPAPNGQADAAPRRPRRWRAGLATAAAGLIILGTYLTTLAFSAIYSRPHTQVAASEWIYANIPPKSTITFEYWDHPLPLSLDSRRDVGALGYNVVVMDFYNDVPACDRSGGKTPPEEYCQPNNAATLEYFYGKLGQVDYIIEGTNRIYGSIPRTPWRSPVQQQFFELLFAGRLGFTQVYDGHSFPALGPFSFDDGFMDESFTVYDHPRVLIFKKERDLSREEMRALFAPALDRPLSPTRYPQGEAAKPLLLNQLVDRLPAVPDFDWNRAIGSNGLVATLLWLLAIELLGLLALPLTLWIFARFPDRGWGLSKLLGWLLFAYPVWLLASVRLGQFTLLYLLVTLGVFAGLAGAAAYHWREHFRATLRGAGRMIAIAEGVFLLAGGFFLSLRVRLPDLWHPIWGGEKPMELTHLNGVLRSVNFPPLDPWFADGTINYYYFGQYLVATIVKLTGIPVEIAFNLALGMLGGLIATAAFSVAAAVAALALRRRASRGATIGFGLLGALLFVGVGNLDGMARVIGRIRDGGPEFNFDNFVWGGSRTIEGSITEFPFFSLLYADLHAHVIALPFTILAVGLTIALAGRGGDLAGGWRGLRATARDFAPSLALLALTLGAVACTNSWDVPTYLLVTGAGLFHALGGRLGKGGALAIVQRLALAAAGTLATGAAAYALYYPFFSHFKALVGKVARTRVPTPLPQFLDHFGLFVGLVVVAILAGYFHFLPRPHKRPIMAVCLALGVLGAAVAARAMVLTAWLAERSRFFAFDAPVPPGTPVSGVTPAFLTLLLILLVGLWVLAWGDLRLQIPLALVIAGVGVALGPEIIFVADDLQGGDSERMNTIFKFYMQGWTLFSLGGVGVLAWIWETSPRWSLAPFRHWQDRLDRRFNAATLRGVLGGLLVFLFCASLVYPLLATPLRLEVNFPRPAGMGPTLNGYRWMEYGLVSNEYPNDACGGSLSFKDDYAAIKWLNETMVGTPVIAEASIGPYRGNGSRFAISTGLPTILGWDRHEYQQRPPEGIGPRMEDVRTLYNSTDEARKLAVLQRYHVSYVVVGAIERHWYMSPPNNNTTCTNPYASPEGLALLEGMAGQYLTPVFRSGETVIYRVLPAAYSSGVAAGDPAPAGTAPVPAATGRTTP